MAVHRTPKHKNYTMIDNKVLRNKQLSLQAKGLLILMLSQSESWQFSVKGLAAICKEGKDAIRGAVRELEAAGYLVRRQITDASGKYSNSVYDIFEDSNIRIDNLMLDNRLAANYAAVEPSVSKLPTGGSVAGEPVAGEPVAGEPMAGEPMAEMPTTVTPTPDTTMPDNAPQLITNRLITKTNNKQSKKDQTSTDTPCDRDIDFERLWRVYPKKINYTAARRAYDDVDVPVEELIDAIHRQQQSDQWRANRGRYIPNLANWLSDRRWTDAALVYDGYIRHNDPPSPGMIQAAREILAED